VTTERDRVAHEWDSTDKPSSANRRGSASASQQPLSRIPGSEDSQYRTPPRIIETDIASVVRQHERIVILGDPGSGKTTLTRYVALHFARACLNHAGTVLVPQDKSIDTGAVAGNEDLGRARLPVLVELGKYASAIPEGGRASLHDYLGGGFSDYGHSAEAFRALFEHHVVGGKALIILDGLDEILETRLRESVARDIETFQSKVPGGNVIIVTSRVAGFRDAPLGGMFERFTLRDMNPEQVKAFARQWYLAQAARQSGVELSKSFRQNAMESADELIAATERNPGIRRLSCNPLLLTLLAIMHTPDRPLPDNRRTLYERATELLLRDWRSSNRRLQAGDGANEDAIRRLGTLAYYIHENVKSGLVDRKTAIAMLSSGAAPFGKEGGASGGVDPKAEALFRHVTTESCLLLERSHGLYGFLHLTFEEYLAALHLTASPATFTQWLQTHRHKSRWREVILLALGSCGPKVATNLLAVGIMPRSIGAWLRGGRRSRFDRILHRDLFLAAHCLADGVPVDARTADSIIRRVAVLASSVRGRRTNSGPRSQVLTLLSPLSSHPSWRVAEAIILAALKDDDLSARCSAAEALGNVWQGSEEAVRALLTALKDDDLPVRWAAAQALGKVGQGSKTVVSALLAALKDDDLSVRQATGAALGNVGQGSETVMRALLAALKDDDRWVRMEAAQALGRVGQGSEEAVRALLATLKDDDIWVRQATEWAIAKVGQGSDEAVRALLAALKDDDLPVRCSAAEALGNVGQESEEVVRALARSVRSRHEDLRTESWQSLLSLEGYLEDSDTQV
jgi:HEAT repeat protein/ABC-type cobalamin/Fe3+-siderophores transport system ATPase subunit